MQNISEDIFFFLGVWLVSFNSTANPFVYALLMPSYRKCVINTFCACVKKSNKLKRNGIQTIYREMQPTDTGKTSQNQMQNPPSTTC